KVDREHEVLVGREEQVLAAPHCAGQRMAGKPVERRRRGFDHGEMRDRHVTHRRACHEGIERFDERLELGELGHGDIVRGAWSQASSRKCAGASWRRATACTQLWWTR